MFAVRKGKKKQTNKNKTNTAGISAGATGASQAPASSPSALSVRRDGALGGELFPGPDHWDGLTRRGVGRSGEEVAMRGEGGKRREGVSLRDFGQLNFLIKGEREREKDRGMEGERA